MSNPVLLSSQHSRSAKHSDRISVAKIFKELTIEGKFRAEYVWIDSTNSVRSKGRTLTLDRDSLQVDQLPIWNFDGSSTGQAPGDDSEILLVPRKFIKDPFRSANDVLVMCECVTPDMNPAIGNNRAAADVIFSNKKTIAEKPWYGFEQEYTLFQSDGQTPLGWPKGGVPAEQGPYYCGIGAEKSFGRDICEAHYSACLYSGLSISGINGEVMPGQWEYQIGPVEGIDAGDQLWLSRYLLGRICEMFGVIVTFHPKPMKGDWNGAGLHTNFSTETMRNDGGLEEIHRVMPLFQAKHEEHIAVYGVGNNERLTGKHETSSIHDFSFGVANRGASIRIPRQTSIDGKGYLEDRRPASSADPYLVSARVAQTVLEL